MAVQPAVPLWDVLAAGWFGACWIGYALFATRHGRRVPSLAAALNRMRRAWMREALSRENRVVDAAIVANLANSATFFASTALLILGALAALLGTTEKAAAVIAEIPFAAKATERLWEIKVIVLIGIFIYAFFKFTWSLRQFNVVSIMVGAAPKALPDDGEAERFAHSAGRLAIFAGESFNSGLRAFYFALAAASWLVHPALFALMSTAIVAVLYHREFRSSALAALEAAG